MAEPIVNLGAIITREDAQRRANEAARMLARYGYAATPTYACGRCRYVGPWNPEDRHVCAGVSR